MAYLQYGTSDKVANKKWQEQLMSAGYDVGNTGADGIFGNNTKSATIEFQKANGLEPDGIVGPKTSAKMDEVLAGKANTSAPTQNATQVTTPGTNNATQANPSTSTGIKGAVESALPESYYAANNVAQQLISNGIPTAPEYTYGKKAEEWADKYENREAFSYDVNEDAMYQMYKDMYIQNGQLASADAMGRAAALTGGYGNSYAQQVGQQTYQNYMNQLNDVALQLYDRAENAYNQEGQNMLNMYNLYMDRDAQQKAEYQNELNNWYNQVDFYTGLANNEYAKAWEQVMADEEKASNNYTKLYNRILAAGRVPTDAELAASGMTQEEAEDYAKVYAEEQAVKNLEKQSSAQSDLMNWIAMGYQPSAEDIAKAGWSQQQAQLLIDSYQASVEAAKQLVFENKDEEAYYRSEAEKAVEAAKSEKSLKPLDDLVDRLISLRYTEEQARNYLQKFYAKVYDAHPELFSDE